MDTGRICSAPIAIVGGGPVGMMLALFLARHGVRTVLFNTEPTTRWHPKGSTHNSRTMEHYRRVGMADAVRRLGLPLGHPRDIAYFTRLNGWELARFAMPSERERGERMRDPEPTDQVPEPLLRANQMYVERHMFECVSASASIELRFGWHVSSFMQDAHGVHIVAHDTAEPTISERWQTQYLVGCDGGQSFVRKSLGIGYRSASAESEGFLSGRMFSTHLQIPALPDMLADREAWMYNVMLPDLRMLLISLNGKDEFLLMSKAASGDERPDDRQIVRRVQAGIGADIDVRVLGHAVWNGGLALVAERFSDGRVYLAGDAIHLFSPTGGFGMNTGIDGAANLAWKLAAAVQGWAGEALLTSYEPERKPIARRNTAAARFLTERVADLSIPGEIENSDEVGQRARLRFGVVLQRFRRQFTSLGVELGARYDGSPIVCEDAELPPDDDPLQYFPSDIPGGRLPHLWIGSAAGHRQSIFDLLHVGFTLLRIGGDAPEPGKFVAAAKLRGIPFGVVDITAPAAGLLYRKRLILVRPDQHIAWRGDRMPEDVLALLDRVVGRAGRTVAMEQQKESLLSSSLY